MEGRDEVAMLGNAFNDMGVRIKELQKELIRKERLAAIGEAAAIIGHDMRNPLSAISASLYLLMEEELNKKNIEKKEVIDISQNIKLNTGEIQKLIDNMLSFARDREPIKREIVLQQIYDEIIKSIRIPENINLQTNFYHDKVFAEPTEFKQMFTNIINNAIEIMPEGGYIYVTSKLEDEKYIVLSVRDTGPGMEAKQLKRIFEAFYSTKEKGTGLGLAAVKRIVNRHNGKVEVASEKGKGTEFFMYFPT
jgi:two-component system, sporulation sensor kinase E